MMCDFALVGVVADVEIYSVNTRIVEISVSIDIILSTSLRTK